MKILILDGDVHLLNVADVTRLAVHVAAGLPGPQVDGALRAARLGVLDEDGEHAWVDVSALTDRVRAAGGDVASVETMLHAARKHGWVREGWVEDGWASAGSVRAHLERDDSLSISAFRAASSDERSKWWRSVLGEYPTGVSIISALDDSGTPQGLVVGTFSSVSLNPPLVSFMPMNTSRSYTAIAKASRFRVSVLGAGHEALCRAFASAPPEQRFEHGEWVRDEDGLPRLRDAVAWFDCDRWQTIPAGDHDIVLGLVDDLGFGEDSPGMPMLFFKGGYGTFTVPRLEFDPDTLGVHLRVATELQSEVQELAESLGAVVTLCRLAGKKVVVLTAANLKPDNDVPPAVGATFPYAAPMGLVFASWSEDPVRQRAWLAAGRDLGFNDEELLHRMTQATKTRGYAVSLGGTMGQRFERVTANLQKGTPELAELWSGIVQDFIEIEGQPEWASHVTSIQVPVAVEGGDPELALVVSGLAGLNVGELDAIAERCRGVVQKFSAALVTES